MLSLLPSRRVILRALCLLSLWVLSKYFILIVSTNPYTILKKIAHTHIQDAKEVQSAVSHLSLKDQFLDLYHFHKPVSNPRIARLFSSCPLTPNPYTNHIRLSNAIYNISMIPQGAETETPHNHYFNPSIIPLPASSAKNPYLLVSRLVTEGFHQESHVCLADFCIPPPLSNHQSPPPEARICTPSDINILGNKGGMRCINEHIKLNIPPTPAKQCTGRWSAFPDIPGFHDPRVFWTGQGEPLIMVNSASAYGCVGLWVVDLRTLVPPLEELLVKQMDRPKHKRILRYTHLTEITRNPMETRQEVEKNWVIFFPTRDESVVIYDLMGKLVNLENDDNLQEHQVELVVNSTSFEHLNRHEGSKKLSQKDHMSMNNHTFALADGFHKGQDGQIANGDEGLSIHVQSVKGGRTLALLSSGGFTTYNLTHPLEPPCFDLLSRSQTKDSLNNTAHWHQGSNSLRLVLCTKSQIREKTCLSDNSEVGLGTTSNEGEILEQRLIEAGLVVHFSIVHRKFSNELHLPLRYERYVVVWEARRPWRLVGVSQWPILFEGEKANPWSKEENWPEHAKEEQDDQEAEEERSNDNREKDNDSSTYFTYSPSIAWAWRAKSDGHDRIGEADQSFEDLGTGYLGEEVLIGIGMDDKRQGFARVKVETLLHCLRLCPGVEPVNEEEKQKGSR